MSLSHIDLDTAIFEVSTNVDKLQAVCIPNDKLTINLEFSYGSFVVTTSVIDKNTNFIDLLFKNVRKLNFLELHDVETQEIYVVKNMFEAVLKINDGSDKTWLITSNGYYSLATKNFKSPLQQCTNIVEYNCLIPTFYEENSYTDVTAWFDKTKIVEFHLDNDSLFIIKLLNLDLFLASNNDSVEKSIESLIKELDCISFQSTCETPHFKFIPKKFLKTYRQFYLDN